jgi:hypothetical protein
MENKMQHMNQSSGTANSSNSNSLPPSSSRADFSSKLQKNIAKSISKKPSVPSPITTKKPPKPPSSNKELVEARSKSSYEVENHRDIGGDNDNVSSDVCSYASPSTTNFNEKNKSRTTFDDTFDDPVGDTINDGLDASILVTDDSENQVFIDKINELTLKTKQQAQIIKNCDAELKLLRAKTIGKSCRFICKKTILSFLRNTN